MRRLLRPKLFKISLVKSYLFMTSAMRWEEGYQASSTANFRVKPGLLQQLQEI